METNSRLDNFKDGLKWMWNDSKVLSLLFPTIVGFIIYYIIVAEGLYYRVSSICLLFAFIGLMTLMIISAGKREKTRERIRQNLASVDHSIAYLSQFSHDFSAEAQRIHDEERYIVSSMQGTTQRFLHLSAELERLNNELEHNNRMFQPRREEDIPDEDF